MLHNNFLQTFYPAKIENKGQIKPAYLQQVESIQQTKLITQVNVVETQFLLPL